MFERGTEDARQAVGRAQDHARRLGHSWVGCEHLLLAVAGADGVAAELLCERGAGPEALEEAIVALLGQGRGTATGDNDDKVALAALGIDLDVVHEALEASFGPSALDRAAASRPRRSRLRRRLTRFGRRPARCAEGSPALPFTARAKRSLELSLRESLRLQRGSIGVDHLALALLARGDTAAWKALVRLGIDPRALRAAVEEALRRTG